MTMSALSGVGVVPVNNAEYLSRTVLDQYTAYVASIKKIFDKTTSNPDLNSTNNQVTAADYDTLIQVLQSVSELAKNGYTETVGTNTLVNYLSRDMVEQLNHVLNTLKLAGITPNSSLSLSADEKINALTAWQNLSSYGVQVIIQNAVNLVGQITTVFDPRSGKTVAISYTRTLQGLVELEYIKQGNDIIFGSLTNLDEALNVSEQILGTLQIIQSISNQINAPSVGAFPSVSGNDPNNYAQNYKAAANAYFTQRAPTPTPTDTAGYELLQAKATLSSQLAFLRTKTTATVSQASNNTKLVAGDLMTALQQVVTDISTMFLNVNVTDSAAVKTAVSKWILDNQDKAIDTSGAQGSTMAAGAIQDRLSQALRNAQSLNETQREDVKRYLHLFEEFYKSANAILTRMSQLIEKVGSNLGAQGG